MHSRVRRQTSLCEIDFVPQRHVSPATALSTRGTPIAVGLNVSQGWVMTLATFTGRSLKETPVLTGATQTRREESFPTEPTTIEQMGIPVALIEGQVLKFLLNSGVATGRQISEQIRLPITVSGELLRRMKTEQLIAHRRAAGVNDYEFELATIGQDRARRLYELGSYFGALPVPFEDYARSVLGQSPRREPARAPSLKRALQDLSIHPDLFSRIGQALTSVGAMFLYGAPGNGKTSIAERLTAAFGAQVWIPRCIFVEGEIIRLFDPNVHEEVAPSPMDDGVRVDRRWVRIKRPTVVVGGELTMESLDLRPNKGTGCMEAPVHMKSNCGTLVIDDFGRQRVSTSELLNRWIVPLEKRYDFLNTSNGKKVQIPFEQVTIFATNLDPSALVDEAFLRRIPYKIEVQDPTEPEFRDLFRAAAHKFSIRCDELSIDRLIAMWYRAFNRPFRYCQPRDLLRQVHDFCTFHGLPPETSDAAVD